MPRERHQTIKFIMNLFPDNIMFLLTELLDQFSSTELMTGIKIKILWSNFDGCFKFHQLNFVPVLNLDDLPKVILPKMISYFAESHSDMKYFWDCENLLSFFIFQQLVFDDFIWGEYARGFYLIIPFWYKCLSSSDLLCLIVRQYETRNKSRDNTRITREK